jgi:DNA polymerase III delta subunit
MNFHVIIGEDDYLVVEAAKKILAGYDDVDIIDSATSTNEDRQLADLKNADASFSTPPFLEPRKATWWKNVNFLPQGGGKKSCSEAVKEALEKLSLKFASSTLPDNQVFILSASKLLMTSTFAKNLKKTAEIKNFSAAKPWEKDKQTAAFAVECATNAGFKFAPGALEVFVSKTGNDSRSIVSEVEKLRIYIGLEKKEATKEDVLSITSPGAGIESPLWELTDALGARNAQGAIDYVLSRTDDSGFAVMVSTVLEKFFRNLAEAKDAAMRKIPLSEEISPFQKKKNDAFLPNWSLMELRLARNRFMKLRELSISGSGSADDLIVAEIARLCAPTRKASK